MLRIAAAWMIGGVLWAQTECAPCHPAQVDRHAATNHAKTLRPILDSEFFRALPDRPIGEARGGFLLSYRTEGGVLAVRGERGAEAAGASLEWAFGAGDQGITPVGRANGRWLEHRISYYTKPGRFDLTLGHAPGPSRSAHAALGVEQSDATIRACFGCHSSASASLDEIRPGVACERCHPGSQQHAKTRSAVTTPAHLTARAQLELCGACHRLTPPGRADDPLNIRFQPLRLLKSKCHLEGKLGCVTCHPAHEDARRNDPAFYRQKCLSCHAAQSAKGDCLSCHMPKSSPAPYLTFTDHFIR